MKSFFIAIMVLMFISLFSTFQLEAEIKVNNKTNNSFFIVRLFGGLIRLRFNFTLSLLTKGAISLILRKTDSKLERQATIEDILAFIIKSYRSYVKNIDQIRYLISKTNIKKFGLDMKIGLDNAAQTAIISGSISAIFSSLKAYMKNKFRLEDSRINIVADFERLKFDMTFDCIINVKLGHIIIMGIRMLIHGIKGGDINGRTSY